MFGPIDPVEAKALKKLAPVPANFRCFLYERLGEGKNSVLQITGAEFREAKSGPYKGKLRIEIKGTRRSCFLTK